MKRYAFTLAGLISACALWFLIPRHDTVAADWKPSLGRQQAIDIATRAAAERGERIGGWKFSLTAEPERLREQVRRRGLDSELLRTAQPYLIRVLAYDRQRQAVLVTLDSSGRVLGYTDRSRAGLRLPEQGLAEAEFARLAGPYAGRYRRTAENLRTQEGIRNAWEWAETPAIVARIEVVTRNGEVVRSLADFNVADTVLDRGRRGPGGLQEFLIFSVFAVAVTLIILAAWSLFRSLVRRTDQIRFAARFAWLAGASQALAIVGGAPQAGTLLNSFERGLAGDARLEQLLAVAVLLTLCCALVAAAGYAAAPRFEWPRWHAAALAGQFRLWTRPVGREAWDGLLGGIALALPAYAAAALSGQSVRFLESPGLLVERWPQLRPLGALADSWEVYAAIVFLAPYVAAKFRHRAARFGIILAAGTVLAALLRPAFPPDNPWRLAVGAGLTAGAYLIYRHAGVLAAWLAPVGMVAIVTGIRLTHVPSAPLREAGWQILALYALATGTALAARLLGREAGAERFLEEMALQDRALPRSERERLKAEFQVARRAQAGMLPASEPALERFDISAVCEPAREVGGDLFDYLQFDDGNWGLCVADVSGKGVPAAIYMTLTKGMLAAARLGRADLPLICGRLNRALVDSGRKRVFVTMSLGVLDESNSTFRHVRAGHNPPIVWRAATGICEFLKPPGIGLGLTRTAAFERHMQEHLVQLDPGDVLVLYSDGLVECMNEAHEQFGEDRLEETLKAWGPLDAAALKQRIVDEARRFRGQADPHDDLTVMVVKARAAARNSMG